ncbi:MAG: GNAT family N-acetyltransferase [Candidatus Hodarchaeales archaeon]
MSGSKFNTEKRVVTAIKFSGKNRFSNQRELSFSKEDKKVIMNDIDDLNIQELRALQKSLKVKTKSRTKIGLKRAIRKQLKEDIADQKRTEVSDVDKRGYRGNHAENEIIDSYTAGGWVVADRPSHGHDVVFKKRRWEKYHDVKEINETVDSGKGKEKGRVQIDKEELKRIKDWEDDSPSRKASFLIKVNHDDGSESLKELSLSDAEKLMKGKADPVKIPYSQINELPDYTLPEGKKSSSKSSQVQDSSSTVKNYNVEIENDRLVLTDKDNDKMMAYADVEIQGDNVTTMFLEVKPDYQGRGLGKQLITEIEDYCVESGSNGVVAVYVTDSSKEFWKKQGFVELGTERNEYYKPTTKTVNSSDLAEEKEMLDRKLTKIEAEIANASMKERRELAGDKNNLLRDIAINEYKQTIPEISRSTVQEELSSPSSDDDADVDITSYSSDLQQRHAIAKNIKKSDFTNLKQSDGLDQVVQPKFTVDYTKKGQVTTTRMSKVKTEEKDFNRVWIVEKDDTAKQIAEAYPDDVVHSLGGNPFTQPRTTHFSKNNRVRTSKDSTIEWRNDRSFGKNFYYPEVKKDQKVVIVTDEDHLGEYINREVSRSIKSDNIEQYSVEGMKSAEFKKLLTNPSLRKEHAHDSDKAFAQEFFVEADSTVNTSILSNMVSASSFYAQHQSKIIDDAYEGNFSTYKQSANLSQNVSLGRIELGIADYILEKQLQQDTKVQIVMDTEAGVQTIETNIRKAPKGNFNVKFKAESQEDLKILTTDETIQYLIQNLNLTGTQSEELISRLYRQGYLSYPRTESDRINLRKEQLSAEELSKIWTDYFDTTDRKLLESTIESGINKLNSKKGKSGIIVIKKSPYKEGDIEHRVLTEIATLNLLATTNAQKVIGKFILEDEKGIVDWSEVVTLINTDKYDQNVGKVIDVKLITDAGVSEIELYNFIKKANIGTPSTRTNKIEAMTKAGFLVKQKERYFVDERMKFFIVENRIRNQQAKKRYPKTPHFDADLTEALIDLRSDLEKDPSVKNYRQAYNEVQKWLHAQYDPYDPEIEELILKEITKLLLETKNRTSIDQEVDELVDDVIEVED